MFWSPRVAHCIDLMHEDMGKVEWVKKNVKHPKCITKYIYTTIRKNTRGKELDRPAITRFATHFLALQSLNFQEYKLQKMFSFDE